MATDPEILDRYRVWHAGDPTTLTPDDVQQLEAYRRAWKKGHVTGLIAAMEYCVDRRSKTFPEALQAVPNWVLVGASDLLEAALKQGAIGAKGKGQTTSPAARRRQNRYDLLRAHEVLIAREAGCKGDDAFEEASKSREGKPGYLKPDGIKKAFKRFQKLRKADPEKYFGITNIHLPEEDNGGPC